MVALSMSLFKRYKLKLNPEVTPGVCPHCHEMSDFVSIVNDYYKCLTCGTDVEQKINGVISGLSLILYLLNRLILSATIFFISSQVLFSIAAVCI